MRRAALPLAGSICSLGLLLVVYRPVLFEGGQFAWDNAAYLYYPLYLRVQQEWGAGRLPLWDPGQNCGEPLLGNPIAAVLYPAKLLYAVLPYAWAVRLYVIAHTVIAFCGVFLLGRSCGLSRAGSCLAAMSYAFGAPVLFLYCNVVFQVGAAWIPWGLREIHRLLVGRGRLAAVGLAVVLALQVLGGDPESAYLTAICGVVYALVLAIRVPGRLAGLLSWPAILITVGLWTMLTLGLAVARIEGPGFQASNRFALAFWVAAGMGVVWRWHRQGDRTHLVPMLARLTGACVLAAALAAVQILPAIEFARRSWRAEGIAAETLYRYSLHPCRVAEAIWPNVFGAGSLKNRSWLQAVPIVGGHEIWAASLYVGGLPLLLALGACGWKGGPPWRAWLTSIAVVGFLAGLGRYGGPLWWVPGNLPAVAVDSVGGPSGSSPRTESTVRGVGSIYWMLAKILPGFGSFRYPSKLLVFPAVAMAVLAGLGWDRLLKEASQSGRLKRFGVLGLGTSLVGFATAVAARNPAVAFFAGRVPPQNVLGSADISGAWADTQWAFAQGSVVFAAVLVLARFAPRHPQFAAALALLITAADLGLANSGLIWTVPQADFEIPPAVGQQIEKTERSNPSPGPFRIHRMTGAFPPSFSTSDGSDRTRDLLVWARGTLHPFYGLPLGLEYCFATAPLQLEDHAAFFIPRLMPLPAEPASAHGGRAGQPVMYYPRRSYDLWGARYFVLPALPDWATPARGYASFLDKTELVYPSPEVLSSKKIRGEGEPWIIQQDWQLRRNNAAYPRAWLVHHARVRPPPRSPDIRNSMMRTLLFMNDPIWTERDKSVLDLRQVALIETDDERALKGFLSPTPVGPDEKVVVVRHDPQRVELKASLDRPGLVILADTYYPGWKLTIDGRPAPILRANRMMRGAAVPSGDHTLVYRYEPMSFQLGAIISIAGLISVLVMLWPRTGARTAMPRKPWPPRQGLEDSARATQTQNMINLF
jgi:hypothetical protein